MIKFKGKVTRFEREAGKTPIAVYGLNAQQATVRLEVGGFEPQEFNSTEAAWKWVAENLPWTRDEREFLVAQITKTLAELWGKRMA